MKISDDSKKFETGPSPYFIRKKGKKYIHEERMGVNDHKRDGKRKGMWRRDAVGEEDERFHARNLF